MAALPRIQYFLGANSPGGFYSLYPELLPPEQARRIYILKGGPGCGKSTLMRMVQHRVQQHGLATEEILCSGDPDSLDALLIPQLNTALVDGTAPHVVEPRLPGAVESYVNLGDCYNSAALCPLRPALEQSMSAYKACYRRAYRCLQASAQLTEDIRAPLTTRALAQSLAKRAKGILSRELPRQTAPQSGQTRQRFLGAVTHRGELCLFDTALAQCGRIYAISDRFGLAHELLVHLLPGILARGFDTVVCPDPMAPDRLAHLLVPELGLAFLSSTPACPFSGPFHRRIRLETALDPDLLRVNRPKLRFAHKVSSALILEAVTSLSQAKAIHDELEGLYNPHVDFERVGEMGERICLEILSMPV